MDQVFIAACHRGSKVEKKSSSGGAFTAITDEWFSEYGNQAVVYGCALDEQLQARHIRAVTSAERDKMRGSKYVSSDVSGVFQNVKNDIQSGLYVLFSGTPCQIAGLLRFLGDDIKNSNQLLTVEVICNGVASHRFFDDYIAHLEKKYKGKAVSCNFRGKSRAGSSTSMEIDFDNGKHYRASSTKFDWFYSLYCSNYIINSGCFNCKYATTKRGADISIADMRRKNKGEDTRYRSLIIVNTPAGKAWTDCALQSMDYIYTTLEELDQPHLYTPSRKPADYERFWEIYENDGYLAAQRYVGNNTFTGYFKSFVMSVLNFLHLAGVVKKIRAVLKK